MRIKHPNLRLAFACLIATALLPACGGGSSSSAGSAGSGSAGVSGDYEDGYNAALVDVLDPLLTDLRALHTSLAGSGAPVQVQALRGAPTLSFRSLAPRQRETLAQSLLTFINRATEVRNAAAAEDAGAAERQAGLTAYQDALRALQLVIAADATGTEQAAAAALNQIAEVDAENPDDSREQIDAVLDNALQAAQTQVASLERALAAAQASGETSATAITRLNRQLGEARANLATLTSRYGTLPSFGVASTRPGTLPRVTTTYHPRRTRVQMVFDTSDSTTTNDERTTEFANAYPIHSPPAGNGRQDERVFDPAGGFWESREYDVTSRGAEVTEGFDLEPDAVVYNPGGSNPRVITSIGPNTSHFPGRGKVYRGSLRFIRNNPGRSDNNRHDQWVYNVQDRLIEQGHDPEPNVPNQATRSGLSGIQSNADIWNNWDAEAHMTFQYKPNGGFTMGFGGTGVIFSDLERYAAKGGRGPTATGRARASGADACGGAMDYCDDPVTANVEISFGAPQADPLNQPSTNYWYVAAQSPRLAAAAAPDLAQAGDQIEDHEIGRYELILSSHAGENRQLAYAAYGLFNFHAPRVDFGGYYERIQTFHYGVDAFENSDGRKPSDLADAIEGTFRGKTTAYIVSSPDNQQWSGHLHPIQNLHRARGDIELRACIGGASCTLTDFESSPTTLTANQIAGAISNFEHAHQQLPDFWTQDATSPVRMPSFANRTIRLRPTDIQDDGTYSGRLNTGGIGGTRDGTYEGAFYGPAGAGLETAGTWQVNFANWGHLQIDAIVGSFGAVCEGDCRPAPAPAPAPAPSP